jgi:hypothetical protein
VAATKRRDTADPDVAVPTWPTVFGDFDMAAGGHTGEHPLDHHLAQQVLIRERRPRVELDLATIRRNGREAVRR